MSTSNPPPPLSSSQTQTFHTTLLPPPGPTSSLSWPETSSSQNPPLFTTALQIREQVFCTEQNCAVSEELDSDDARSWHWILYDSSDNTPIGTIRLIPPPHAPHPAPGIARGDEPSYVKVGRLAVLREYRGFGLGRRLVEGCLEWAGRNGGEIGGGWGESGKGAVLLHAQVQLEGMYRKMGFERDELLGTWMEEGIWHYGMWRVVDVVR